MPFLILFGLPALIAILAFVGAYFAARRRTKWMLACFGSFVAIVLILWVAWWAPYMWASHLELTWFPAKPKTRVEMESYLSLYSTREIQPSKSDWGRKHVLREGDRMIQYMILWAAPLEVVYDCNNNLLTFYTSYE